ncbi:MAG: radical SAM protein [Pseudomonadota bacterium]
MTDILNQEQILGWRVAQAPGTGTDLRAPMREGLKRHGHYHAGQMAGRFWPVACVALEITQRCNLDCSLCYLSEAAEAAYDVPLTVLFRRLSMIHSHYGPGVSVQITGGDPTLRTPEDLEAIVVQIRKLGLRSCLMTNGIRATRSLLSRLADAGLDDVAFHVDLTQQRRGYVTEASLNELRERYIRRAKALGLRVLFNTTVHDNNLEELPALARFFRDHASDVSFASFQMQADTGRGTLGVRGVGLTRERVVAALEQGYGCELDTDVAAIGHPQCNAYAVAIVAGGHAVSLLSDKRLLNALAAALEAAEPIGARAALHFWPAARRAILRRPDLALRACVHMLRRIARLGSGLWQSRGRVHAQTIFVHNFMDAKHLERERCEGCVFMVATEKGPLSMCVHNAKRDVEVFRPARTEDGRWWSAATGEMTTKLVSAPANPVPLKRLKGKARLVARGD